MCEMYIHDNRIIAHSDAIGTRLDESRARPYVSRIENAGDQQRGVRSLVEAFLASMEVETADSRTEQEKEEEVGGERRG